MLVDTAVIEPDSAGIVGIDVGIKVPSVLRETPAPQAAQAESTSAKSNSRAGCGTTSIVALRGGPVMTVRRRRCVAKSKAEESGPKHNRKSRLNQVSECRDRVVPKSVGRAFEPDARYCSSSVILRGWERQTWKGQFRLPEHHRQFRLVSRLLHGAREEVLSLGCHRPADCPWTTTGGGTAKQWLREQ